jgi:hypothetical protein
MQAPWHVPQSSVPPQPSVTRPHVKPRAAHVVRWQVVHTWLNASQASPAPLHVPQSTWVPQLSVKVPHLPVQVSATQGLHVCVAPSQTLPRGHVPQAVVLPHASSTNPHWAPAELHAPAMH